MTHNRNENKEKLTHEPQQTPAERLTTTLAHLHGHDDAILFAPDVTADVLVESFLNHLLKNNCDVIVPRDVTLFDGFKSHDQIYMYEDLKGKNWLLPFYKHFQTYDLKALRTIINHYFIRQNKRFPSPQG